MLCGFQIDLPKININIGVIVNILACFIESMAKTHVCQGITSVRRTHLTIKVRVQNMFAIHKAFQKNEKSSLQWAFSTCDTRWAYITYWGEILKFKISLVF